MSLNKSKAYNIYRVKFSKEEQNQVTEIQRIKQDFANRGASRSGVFIKVHREIFEKHYEVKIDCFINAILESFPEDEIIDERAENEVCQELSTFSDTQYQSYNSSLSQLITATGLYRAGISGATLSNSHFNEIKSLKLGHIKHLIEKHNRSATQNKKRNSFWNTRNGVITAISTFVIALTGITALIIGISPKSNGNMGIPIINKFELIPAQIKLGDSAKIIWDISNSDSAIIDNKIGLVPFYGSKKIYPLGTSTYRLSAFLSNKELSITNKIIVVDSLNNIVK